MSVRPEARPRRLVSRYELSLRVRVQPAGLPSMTCEARNVCVSGMFLVTDTVLAPHSRVAIAVSLPDGRAVTLGARVVHVLSAARARSLGGMPGVGARFEGLGRKEQAFVEELVAWARAHDPRPRIPRVKPGADQGALQHDPMLGLLLGYLDGKRDPEALAQELALELETIERMLAELERHGTIELIANKSTSLPPSAAAPPGQRGANERTSRAPASTGERDAPQPSAASERAQGSDPRTLFGFVPGSSASRGSMPAADEAERVERGVEPGDEEEAYRKRAEWLAAAEALRGRMSIPPPAPGLNDGSDELIDLRVSLPPADGAPTAKHKRLTRDPSARAHAAAAALRRASGLPPRPSATPTQPPPGAASPSGTERSARTGGAGSLRPTAASPARELDRTAPSARAPRQPSASSGRASGLDRAGATARPSGASLPPSASSHHADASAKPTLPPTRASLPPSASSGRAFRFDSAGTTAKPAEAALPPSASSASGSAGTAARPAGASLPPSASSGRASGEHVDASARPTQSPTGASLPAASDGRISGVDRAGEGRASLSPTEAGREPGGARSLRPGPSGAPRSGRPSRGPLGGARSRSVRPTVSQAEAAAQAAAAQAAAAAALSARGRPSQTPGPSKAIGADPPLGAAGQLLVQAETAYSAGDISEAARHVKLLMAMTFDEPRLKARYAELKQKVMRTAAVDFEKQAAHEEKQQQWAQAARSWLRVAEGRPTDSLPLQRAALALLRAGTDLRASMEHAKRAVELAPNDAEAHRTLAKVYVAADMQASARRELEAAQRCSGGSSEESPTGLLKRLLSRDDAD